MANGNSNPNINRGLNGIFPLSYMGVNPSSPAQTVFELRAPTPNDSKNFLLGTLWVWQTAVVNSSPPPPLVPAQIWMLTALAQGQATWTQLESSSVQNLTFAADSGTAVPTVGGVINFNGAVSGNITTAASGNAVTIAVSGTTNHALQIGNAGGSLTSLAVGTNGQLPIGSTGASPVMSTLTAGSGITVTNGAGSITIAATNAGDIRTITGDSGGAESPSAGNFNFTGGTTGLTFAGSAATETLTGTLIVANGGTGDTSFTAYSVITGGTTSTGALQNVSGVGTSGQLLTSNGAGALPTWQSTSGSTGSSFLGTGGSPVNLITSVGSTTWIAPFSTQNETTQALSQIVCPIAGTISHLYVYAASNPSTINCTFTLNKNSANTALVATVTALTTGVFSDTTHSVSVAAGDLIQFECSAAATNGIQGSIVAKFVG